MAVVGPVLLALAQDCLPPLEGLARLDPWCYAIV